MLRKEVDYRRHYELFLLPTHRSQISYRFRDKGYVIQPDAYRRDLGAGTRAATTAFSCRWCRSCSSRGTPKAPHPTVSNSA